MFLIERLDQVSVVLGRIRPSGWQSARSAGSSVRVVPILVMIWLWLVWALATNHSLIYAGCHSHTFTLLQGDACHYLRSFKIFQISMIRQAAITQQTQQIASLLVLRTRSILQFDSPGTLHFKQQIFPAQWLPRVHPACTIAVVPYTQQYKVKDLIWWTHW